MTALHQHIGPSFCFLCCFQRKEAYNLENGRRAEANRSQAAEEAEKKREKREKREEEKKKRKEEKKRKRAEYLECIDYGEKTIPPSQWQQRRNRCQVKGRLAGCGRGGTHS